MNTLIFDVFKNTIKRTDGFNPVSSENNYSKLKFRFKENDDWCKCNIITASFWMSIDDIVKDEAELMADDLSATFAIPPEFIGSDGMIKVGLQGTYINGDEKPVTISTYIILIHIQKGSLVEAKASQILYEQIIALCEKKFKDLSNFLGAKGDTLKIDDINQLVLCSGKEPLSRVKLPTVSSQMLRNELHYMVDNGLISGISTGVYCVSDFGAVGDGITDDTDAIQNAVDFICENGGCLRFFSGMEYIISRPIKINAKLKSFEIDFNFSTITAFESPVEYFSSEKTNINTALYISCENSNQKRIATIKNLIINGNHEVIHTGLYLARSNKINFENINIIDVRKGIYYVKGQESFFNNIHISRNSELDITDEIDVLTSDCIGIECKAADNHFSNIIIIDFVIGTKFTVGDNRLYGIHVWNYYCKEQYKKSVCFMNGGTNFYTDCVADHFHIAWYVMYSTPFYLQGCNISNQLVNLYSDSGNISGFVPVDSYCFYFDEKYSKYKTGSDIIVENTRISGNNKYFEDSKLSFSNLEICNINYKGVAKCCQRVPDNNMKMVTGDILIDDKNNVSTNHFGKIKSINKTLNFENCSTDFKDLGTIEVTSNNWIKDYIQVGTNVKATIDNGIVSVLSQDDSTYRYICVDYSKIEGINVGDLVLLAYKYKTNGDSKVLSFGKGLSKYTDLDSGTLIGDGEWHNGFCFSIINSNSNARIQIGDKDKSDAVNSLDLTEFRIINLSKYNIPKYFLETDKSFRKRLIKLFGNDFKTSIEITANSTISYLSVPCKFDCKETFSTIDQPLGFSKLGRPKFEKQNEDYEFTLEYQNNGVTSVMFDLSQYSAVDLLDTANNQDRYNNENGSFIKVSIDGKFQFYLTNESYDKNIAVPAGSILKLAFVIRAGYESTISHLNINPYPLSNLNLYDSVENDYTKIPLYVNGEIYLVAKNTKGENLPTVYYEINYIKNLTESGNDGYTLTANDKQAIVDMVVSAIPTTEGVEY